MHSIASHLADFHQAIVDNKPIHCDNIKNTWHCEGWITTLFRRIFRQEASRDSAVIKAFNRCLDQLEKIPVQFNAGQPILDQKVNFKDFIETATAIECRYKSQGSKQISKSLEELKIRVLALQYRMNNNETASIDTILIGKLEEAAKAWKAKQEILINRELTEFDKKQIKEMCRYPQFALELLSCSRLRDEFMKWSLLIGLSVDIFVQFPSIQKLVTQSYLAKRIGRIGAETLKIELEPLDTNSLHQRKIVSLKMEGSQVNILDENKEVTFQHNYTLSIKKIFEVFQNKNYRSGNLEYTSQGVTNWNSCKHASWNGKTEKYEFIDFNSDQWWKQLPHIETLTQAQVAERYGKFLNENEGGICARASRTSVDLNGLNCHSWIEVLMPNGDGTYLFLPMGKYAAQWVESWYESLTLVGATLPATLEYPDENIFRANRQQGGTFFTLDSSKLDKLMNILKEEFKRTKEGNIVFQIMGDNCSTWVQSVLDKLYGENHVPRLFDMSLWESDLKGPAACILKSIRAIPFHSLRHACLRAALYVLGGWKKVIYQENGQLIQRGLLEGRHIRTQRSDSPAMFVERCITGHFAAVPMR